VHLKSATLFVSCGCRLRNLTRWCFAERHPLWLSLAPEAHLVARRLFDGWSILIDACVALNWHTLVESSAHSIGSNKRHDVVEILDRSPTIFSVPAPPDTVIYRWCASGATQVDVGRRADAVANDVLYRETIEIK